MLEIMFESNIGDVNEFVIHLPISVYKQTEKQLFAVEDWNINPQLFVVPKKSPSATVAQYRNIVKELLDECTIPNLKDILSYYNSICPYEYNLFKIDLGKSGKRGNQLDIAYYMIIHCNIDNLNCSQKIRESLSEVRIRISNHISPSEKGSINSHNNVKFYSEQVIGLYEQLFNEYTSNIFRFCTEFLDTLSKYDEHIDTFNDIDVEDINKLKFISVQGDFD